MKKLIIFIFKLILSIKKFILSLTHIISFINIFNCSSILNSLTSLKSTMKINLFHLNFNIFFPDPNY